VKLGYRVALVMLNHTNQNAKIMSKSWQKGEVDGVLRIVLDDFIGFREEINLCHRQRTESIRLRQAMLIEKESFMRALLNRASNEALTSGTSTSLRIAHQVGVLVSRLKPKVVMVAHEGHSWERSVFASVRSVSRKTICLAYQHAAVFRLQHAIRRNLSQKYNPDYILAAGNVGRSQLSNSNLGIPIRVLGSNRIIQSKKTENNTCAVKFRGGKACLVLPEGIISECNLLFEFSLQCAINHPDIFFIWRLHPTIEFEQLIKNNKRLSSLPKNIILSTNTLPIDIGSSTWAIYRGSTAIIQAVSVGVKPIYITLPNEMTIDPLYELAAWKETLMNASEFREIVTSSKDNSNPNMRETAMKYCREYYSPFDLSQVTTLIDERKVSTNWF
jgi:hypothetical protein